MRFGVTFVGRIIVVPDAEGSAKIIESHLDHVMEELLVLGAEDPSLEIHLATGKVTFELEVDAANPVLAISEASGAIRTAIHAAGGSTPDWPSENADAWSVTLVSVSSSEVHPAAEAHDEDLALT